MTLSDFSAFTDAIWRVSWQAAALAGIVWIVCRFAKKAPASFRQALWLLVLAKFILPPLGELPIGFTHERHPQDLRGLPVLRVMRQVEKRPAMSRLSAQHETLPNVTTEFVASEAVKTVESRLPLEWPILLWLLGAGTTAIFLLICYSAQARLVRASRLSGERVLGLAVECARQLRVRRCPDVRVSEKVSSPMVVGLLRHTILLPSGVPDDCNVSDLRAMLLHELTHVKRQDMLTLWIYQFAKVIYFFHPAFWLVGRELKKERELACDEMVLLSSCIRRKEYAAGYVAALKMATRPRTLSTSLAMAEPLRMEEKRLRTILTGSLQRTSAKLMAALILLAVVAVPNFTGCSSSISKKSGPVKLASSAWPKGGGDLRNMSLGLGTAVTWKETWVSRKLSPFRSAPVVGPDGSIYVGCTKDKLYCLDGKTGSPKWSADTSSVLADLTARRASRDDWSMVYGSPALSADGTIYVGARDGCLYAFDSANGRRKWKFQDNKSIGGSPTSPTIGDDGIVYFTGQGAMFAVDGHSGELKWKYRNNKLVSTSKGAPVIGRDGTIYAAWYDGIYAFNPNSGRVKWQYSLPTKLSKTPSQSAGVESGLAMGANDAIFFCDGLGVFHSVDSLTGKELWKTALQQHGGANPDDVWTSPTVGRDGTVYAVTQAGYVTALNGGTGKILWATSCGWGNGWMYYPVVSNDGTVHINTLGQANKPFVTILRSFDGKTGRWKHDMVLSTETASNAAPLAIGADGTLYAGDGVGRMHAIH